MRFCSKNFEIRAVFKKPHYLFAFIFVYLFASFIFYLDCPFLGGMGIRWVFPTPLAGTGSRKSRFDSFCQFRKEDGQLRKKLLRQSCRKLKSIYLVVISKLSESIFGVKNAIKGSRWHLENIFTPWNPLTETGKTGFFLCAERLFQSRFWPQKWTQIA